MQDSTPEMPIGFALTLALHPSAMQRYASMDEKMQQQYLGRAANASTRAEMISLIKELEDSAE